MKAIRERVDQLMATKELTEEAAYAILTGLARDVRDMMAEQIKDVSRSVGDVKIRAGMLMAVNSMSVVKIVNPWKCREQHDMETINAEVRQAVEAAEKEQR